MPMLTQDHSLFACGSDKVLKTSTTILVNFVENYNWSSETFILKSDFGILYVCVCSTVFILLTNLALGKDC